MGGSPGFRWPWRPAFLDGRGGCRTHPPRLMYTSRVDVYINLGGCVQQPHSRTRYPCNMNDDDDGDTGVSRVIFYLPGKRKKRQKPKPDILLPKPGNLLRQLETPLPPRSPPTGWAPGGERARKLPTENTLGSLARYLGYPYFFWGDPSSDPRRPQIPSQTAACCTSGEHQKGCGFYVSREK